MLSKCPNCGGSRYLVHAQAKGAVIVYYDNSGIEVEVEYEGLWFHRSKVVRCEECEKIRPDLICKDGKVLPK